MFKNKNTNPKNIIFYMDPNTHTLKQLKIQDEKTNQYFMSLTQQIYIRQTISKIHLTIFCFNCLAIAIGLYLYITRFNTLLPYISILGLVNTLYLKRYNDWQAFTQIARDKLAEEVYVYWQSQLEKQESDTT